MLRRIEYYENCNKNKFLTMFLKYRFRRISDKLGIEIGRNVLGPAAVFLHKGGIIINPHTRIGENCRINAGVLIGTKLGTSDQCPTIGKNCFIGPGAKIFGKITIGDNVAIGANAVVTKNVPDNVTVVGVPARIIEGSNGTDGVFAYYIK